MEQLLLLLIPFLLFGCNRPEETPEVRDPIYQEFQSQQASVAKAIGDTQKVLDEKKSDINSVKPQTGQIKYAQKRLWETQRTLDSLIQQQKYWTIRLEERKKAARIDYMKAFSAGTTWPDPKEFQEYSTEKRLREAKQGWDQKARIEKYKTDNPIGPAPAAKTEGAKSASPPIEGGE